MTFDHAAKFPMPFGKHRGVPLEGVLFCDASYLDWMATKFEWDGLHRWMMPSQVHEFKMAFAEFMARPDTIERIEKAKLDRAFARQNANR